MPEADAHPIGATISFPERARSRLAEVIDIAVSRPILRCSALGREMALFSRMTAQRVLPAARGLEPQECQVAFSSTDEGRTVTIETVDVSAGTGPSRKLAEFLSSLSIHSLVFDSDLESNQMRDVLETLWSVRSQVGGERPTWWDSLLGRDRMQSALASGSGLRVSCAEVTLDEASGQLRVRNCCCPLTFPRAVRAYMRRGAQFNNHRAFFRVAPRCGMAVASLTLLPVLVALVLGRPPYFILAVGICVAALVGLGAVVVLEAIGVVEYGKEHQAKQLQQQHQELARAHSRVQADLERALRVQRGLIPDRQLQPFPEAVCIAHSSGPEMAVGGSYCDIKSVGNGRLAIVFADVAGRGTAAAFVTGIIKRRFELRHDAHETPSEFLTQINDTLELLTPSEAFASIVFAVYDVPGGVLTYANAGHNPPPMVVRRENGNVENLDATIGMAAGILPDYVYPQSEVELAPGDKFVLCTDGVAESANKAREQFGLERLRALLGEGADRPAAELQDRVLAAVAQHSSGERQANDQTVLIMEVLK